MQNLHLIKCNNFVLRERLHNYEKLTPNNMTMYWLYAMGKPIQLCEIYTQYYILKVSLIYNKAKFTPDNM